MTKKTLKNRIEEFKSKLWELGLTSKDIDVNYFINSILKIQKEVVVEYVINEIEKISDFAYYFDTKEIGGMIPMGDDEMMGDYSFNYKIDRISEAISQYNELLIKKIEEMLVPDEITASSNPRWVYNKSKKDIINIIKNSK